MVQSESTVFFGSLEGYRRNAERGAYWQALFGALMLRCAATALNAEEFLWSGGRDYGARLAYLSELFLLRDNSLPEMNADEAELVRAFSAHVDALDVDVLPRIFDQALQTYARIERGHATTPGSLAELLVGLAAPSYGKVYDPCCGCGGLLVHAHRYARSKSAHAALDLYGQEFNAATRRVARMHVIANGIAADLGPGASDSLESDCFPRLMADVVLADAPFNVPAGSRRDEWVQHCLRHLAPMGTAVVTLPNGALSNTLNGERRIREQLVRGGQLDCVITLPGKIYEDSKIPVSVWILSNVRSDVDGSRVRLGETLFIDASHTARRSQGLDSAISERIVNAYHAWKSGGAKINEASGFCRAARVEEIAEQNFNLSPGRYVDAMPAAEQNEPLEQVLNQLKARLAEQLNESARLDAEISARLGGLSSEL